GVEEARLDPRALGQSSALPGEFADECGEQLGDLAGAHPHPLVGDGAGEAEIPLGDPEAAHPPAAVLDPAGHREIPGVAALSALLAKEVGVEGGDDPALVEAVVGLEHRTEGGATRLLATTGRQGIVEVELGL